jgi:hypothetical protein
LQRVAAVWIAAYCSTMDCSVLQQQRIRQQVTRLRGGHGAGVLTRRLNRSEPFSKA